MTQDTYIDFPGLIDYAMRDVVRKALQIAEKQGLPGDHHFFISFRTDFPGVKISQTLLAKHQHEMTIVLQHQFWDLKVAENQFSITLSFNNVPEHLLVPFQAMTAFADPSVKFGLQFHTFVDEDLIEDMLEAEEDLIAKLEHNEKKDRKPEKGGDDVVVTLDAFRNKRKKPTDKK